MKTIIKKIQFTEQSSAAEENQPTLFTDYLGLLAHVPVECQVRLGTLSLTIEKLRHLKQGETLLLEQTTTAPVDLLLHGQIIARGELMSSEDYFALRITEVAS